MNDQELITAVRQSVHGVRMNVPADQIVSRSRAIRASGHRRLAAGITAVAAAGSVVLGLGLSGVLSAAPDGGGGTIRTAAFTLTRNANGTDTLTLSNSQMLDPAAVQQALAQHGIPALVKIDTICSSNPALPGPASIGVLTVQIPGVNPADPGPHRVLIPANAVTVINPAAMPAGTELFLGYVNSGRVHALNPRLIYTSSYTCSAGLPPGDPVTLSAGTALLTFHASAGLVASSTSEELASSTTARPVTAPKVIRHRRKFSRVSSRRSAPLQAWTSHQLTSLVWNSG